MEQVETKVDVLRVLSRKGQSRDAFECYSYILALVIGGHAITAYLQAYLAQQEQDGCDEADLQMAKRDIDYFLSCLDSVWGGK